MDFNYLNPSKTFNGGVVIHIDVNYNDFGCNIHIYGSFSWLINHLKIMDCIYIHTRINVIDLRINQ